MGATGAIGASIAGLYRLPAFGKKVLSFLRDLEDFRYERRERRR